MTLTLVTFVTFTFLSHLSVLVCAQQTSGCARCTEDQYCFQGSQTLCIGCNTACDGCSGPGADECNRCATGFTDVNGICTQCVSGRFGVACNGTCHCLDNAACDHVTGTCTGKCAKGYYQPPQCQDECPDLFYGIDCLGECHCLNNSVCDKVLGFCPNNLCHPDWAKFACSKRLPKLAVAPMVTIATCSYLTVTWPVWREDTDFGDLPVAEYRLWWRLNGTNTTWEGYRGFAHDPNTTLYSANLTSLVPDAYYVVRVDVHYRDNEKVADTTSSGLVTYPPVRVPCTTTTKPPPVTVPIIIGTDVFDSLTVANGANNSALCRWSLAPSLAHFSWNVSLRYQRTGIGDCDVIMGGAVVTADVTQATTSYTLENLEEWSEYTVTLSAQGQGSVSGTNGSSAVTFITREIPPSGNISQLTVSARHSANVSLYWTPPPCPLRGGKLLRYDVMVAPSDVSGATQVVTSNVTSVVVTGLRAYTSYVVSVRYVSRAGEGAYSQGVVLTTAQGVPAAVSISSLTATTTTITVLFLPPSPTNGVVTQYHVLYSHSATFTSPQSLTFTDLHPNGSLASAPVLKRLDSDTTYYVKVRASTAAGDGPYGGAVFTRTLLAAAQAPRDLLQTSRNTSCVALAWLPPQQLVPLTGYTVTVISLRTGQGDTLSLPPNATSFTRCDLDPGAVYNISVSSRSGAGVGAGASLLVSTEQATPPAPPPPLLLNVSDVTAAVELEPVAFRDGPVTWYLVEVERLTSGSGTRRKRLAEVPGYVTAQLSPDQVSERRVFVVGDGRTYNGYVNVALEAGQDYRLYYVVISTLNNVTKSAYSAMAAPLSTLAPRATSTPLPATHTQAEEGSDQGVIIAVILALVFIILVVVVVVVAALVWRRRRRMKFPPPPPSYLEMDQGTKVKDAAATPPAQTFDPELYWNEVTSLRQSRYIVVGRECVPDRQLVAVSTVVAKPGAAKVTFRKEFESLPRSFPQATTRRAEQQPGRNRFPHILPYDHSLVPLQPDRSSGNTYVNASYMSGYKRQRAYIAAQSPYNEDTALDFWRLIHQHAVKTVVMVTNAVEDNIVKCTQFWPTQGQGQVSIGCFHLELKEEAGYADWVVRDVGVRQRGEEFGRTVRLFDFTSWPDHGVPPDPIPFLDMRYKVRQYHADDPGPVLVHCGTGVARTGVFIAVDSLIEQYASEGRVSVFSTVRKQRKERPRMVRTLKQYCFIYNCLLEEFHAGDTVVDPVTIRPKFSEWVNKNSKTGRSFLRDQFQLLQRLTPPPDPATCSAALLPDNVKRNRYPDVIPSDLHRPPLSTPAKLAHSDYINAVFVDGYRKRNQFIITQTPLHTTLIDFWRLVYDHHVTTVVMMDEFRHGDSTCAEYWPHDVIMKQWEPFFVETTASFQEENVTVRNLKVTSTLHPHAPPRHVRQFTFHAWGPASFTPLSKTMALDLVDMVTEHSQASAWPDSPIVVHCEDGATRSGLFVTLTLLCERVSEEEEVDVYHVIKHVKRRRAQVISDYDQYRFCYKALWDFLSLRMEGGTFTDTCGQSRADRLYGSASLTLTSQHDALTSTRQSLY